MAADLEMLENCRNHARELRKIAGECGDAMTKKTLLAVADEFDVMAHPTEPRARPVETQS